MNMKKGIKLLKTIRKTMLKVVRMELDLVMPCYYRGTGATRICASDIQHCGYAACMIGYAAIELKCDADDLFEDMRRLIGNDITSSLFAGANFERLGATYNQDLYTARNLEHPHLLKMMPTAKEALSFLTLTIQKLEKRHEH